MEILLLTLAILVLYLMFKLRRNNKHNQHTLQGESENTNKENDYDMMCLHLGNGKTIYIIEPNTTDDQEHQ